MLKNETIAVEITILLRSGDLHCYGYNNNHLNITTTGFMVKKTHLLQIRDRRRTAVCHIKVLHLWTYYNVTQLPPLLQMEKSYNSYGHWRACPLKLNLNICCFYGFAKTTDSAFFPRRMVSLRLTWAKCKSQHLRLDFGF